MGPIHRANKDGEERLKGGESYKKTWAAMYLEDTNQNAPLLFEKIRNELPALMKLYTEEVLEGFRGDEDEELAWIFLLDGCALLEFIRNYSVDLEIPGGKLKIKGDQLVLVQQDLLLLENQLPYHLLTLLSNEPAIELHRWILSFLMMHPMITPTMAAGMGYSRWSEGVKIIVDEDQPPHLLHLLRHFFLGYSENESNKDGGGRGWDRDKPFPTYRNIKELKAAGIQVKSCPSNRPIQITFSLHCLSGELRLPTMYMDLTTPSTYLNMMAYEACPDFGNNCEISSYVQLLTSLINHPDDVKELRSCGCMINFDGSDVEIANVLNFISAHSVPNAANLDPVRHDIERYFRSGYRPWLAKGLSQAYHAYFSNSGSFIAASVALALTFIQTWFTVRCSK